MELFPGTNGPTEAPVAVVIDWGCSLGVGSRMGIWGTVGPTVAGRDRDPPIWKVGTMTMRMTFGRVGPGIS